MRNDHQPDNEFVTGLERHLTSELRRRQRFAPVERSAGFRRFARVSILVIACAATGVAAAKTVEHIENSKRRILHVARIEASTEQLLAHKNVTEEMVSELEERVVAGLIREDDLAEAVIQSKLIDFELEKALLDLEEVHMSGEAPANELHAPLQGGRDFVTERLRVDYQRAELIRNHIEEQTGQLKKKVEAGLLHEKETSEMDQQVAGSEMELEKIQRQIDLRAAYLSGDISAREIAFQQIFRKAKDRLATAEMVYMMTEEQLKEVSDLHAKGLIPESELRQAEYQMINARAEYRIAEIEFELLEEKLED